MSYLEDKAARTKAYQKRMLMVTRDCTACSGSGRYDHCGSPKCGACEGTGKEEVTLKYALEAVPYYLERKASYEKQLAEAKWPDHHEEKKALAESVKRH